MPSLAEAIDRLTEANAFYRKRRALAKHERTLQRAMSRAFRAEGRAVVAGLATVQGSFPTPKLREAPAEAEWLQIWNDATTATLKAFLEPLTAGMESAFAAGIAATVAETGIAVSFDLAHPAAAAYVRDHGAEQVTRIRETTREELRRIMGQAIDEGWTFDQTARAIVARYRHFAGPARGAAPSPHVSRAHAIAVYELGDAYEFATMATAREMQADGMVIEKRWLSAGDARVRPDHAANAAEGWMPLDQVFGSGHERPPTDPGCRCSLLTRRKPEP